MDAEEIQKLIQKKQLEEDLRSEFEATIQARIDRYLEVKPHEIIADTHFSGVSTEISALFRDGQFYGCIALSQAVGEALVRYMCQKNNFKAAKGFENNLEKLSNRRFLDADVKDQLAHLWTGRDDYHHLNPNIERDRLKLEELARAKARLLMEIEKEVFGFTVSEGRMRPKHPQYWDIDDKNQAQVFLRFE
ncbi:MAG: hypothetical protein BZY87_09185 [SAR202 cluster bacterium Io17-Chloro-G6]|nr:MAG: hypothetical protein BZY87_09185 [SAR202 cluster bacterium Io17-Chloro-G6]